MVEKALSEFTDKELLEESKKVKSSFILNAFFIGFLVGIVIFSVVKSTIGFFTIIPLYLAYRALSNSKDKEHQKAIDQELKARNLK